MAGLLTRWLRSTAMLCLLLGISVAAWGQNDRVLVIGDTTRPYVNTFVRALKESLAKSALTVNALDINASGTSLATLNGYRCVVTVGNEAARLASAQPITVPVLHALVTDALANELYGENSPKSPRSFLLVEQPVSRLLLLANRSMPERKRMGILYGPASIQAQGEVQGQASRMGLVLVEREIRSDAQLNEALIYFNENADLLITFPDPVVVNEGSIKSLMLGAYHGNLPLLGYSQAMVKAGSLMAVHTTPDQFGRQSGELIANGFWKDPLQSGVRFYPRYFQVSVNYQVAQALGIDLPDERELELRIRRVEQWR